MEEPDQVLRAFVHGLPDTIREVILAQACIAFDHFEARTGFDFSAAFDELIQGERKAWRAMDVARMMGVIEVLLEPDETHRKMFEQLAAEHGDELFSKMALQAPLRERHLERARQEFQALREGVLSPAALRLWWNYLQAKNPLR